MENASKALIIAGAILLSILIIALGVFVFNQSKSAMENVNLSDQEVSAFNSKYESYKGVQNGSNVKSLINAIRTYNNSTSENQYINLTASVDTKKWAVDAESTTTSEFLTTAPNVDTYRIANNIKSGEKYVVILSYNKAGFVTGADIYGYDYK